MHVPNILSNVLSLNSLYSILICCSRIDTLRGVLTDGHSWIFIIIMLNPNGNGAKFRCSSPIEFQWGMPSEIIVKPWPDVLAGILLHWVSVGPTL